MHHLCESPEDGMWIILACFEMFLPMCWWLVSMENWWFRYFVVEWGMKLDTSWPKIEFIGVLCMNIALFVKQKIVCSIGLGQKKLALNWAEEWLWLIVDFVYSHFVRILAISCPKNQVGMCHFDEYPPVLSDKGIL